MKLLKVSPALECFSDPVQWISEPYCDLRQLSDYIVMEYSHA